MSVMSEVNRDGVGSGRDDVGSGFMMGIGWDE